MHFRRDQDLSAIRDGVADLHDPELQISFGKQDRVRAGLLGFAARTSVRAPATSASPAFSL
jgi:hypothetical protein